MSRTLNLVRITLAAAVLTAPAAVPANACCSGGFVPNLRVITLSEEKIGILQGDDLVAVKTLPAASPAKEPVAPAGQQAKAEPARVEAAKVETVKAEPAASEPVHDSRTEASPAAG